jgi:hypothetical protein
LALALILATMKSEYLGLDVHGRAIVHVEARSLDALAADLRVASDTFVLGIAADTTVLDGPDLVAAATRLIKRGASYVCCWGPGCERLHDCFDEAELSPETDTVDGHTIMTTWHNAEPLEEMVWFALNSTLPTSFFTAATRTVVLASIAQSEWSDRMKSYVQRGAPLPGES